MSFWSCLKHVSGLTVIFNAPETQNYGQITNENGHKTQKH